MGDEELLAERFETNRTRLRAVAYRMLGSTGEADDAVQEAWLRLSRSDVSSVDNLSGWLTTVVARVCLDMLRSRTARREDLIGDEIVPLPDRGQLDPEREAVYADSVGMAMLVVLEALTPSERLAFVLHDMFAVPFEEIAPIVGRSVEATRQLASRGRRRVRGSEPADAVDVGRQHRVVEAFLAASRQGRFEDLLSLLDPDVVLRIDPTVLRMGGAVEASGARAVAETFSGKAAAARLVLIDGLPGAVWSHKGIPMVAFVFTTYGERITGIEMIGEREALDAMELVPLKTLEPVNPGVLAQRRKESGADPATPA